MKTSKLLKTLSWLSMFAIVVKMLAFLRESFISYRYGVGFITDIYFFEDGLVNIINSVFASIISSTFIPLYLEIKSDEEKKRYTNVIITVQGIICIVLITFFLLFTDEFLHILVPGFYENYDMNYVIQITRIFIPTLLMIFLENVLIVLLQANGYYSYSNLQSLIINISLIGYLLFGYKFGIMGIIITKIISHVVLITILLATLKKKKLFKYKFTPDFKDEKLKKMLKLSLPVVIVSILSQFNYLVDRTMSSLLSSGSMSLLSYASTIAMLIYYVIGSSFNNVFYTTVSKVQNNKDEITRELVRFLKYLLRILIPICTVIVVFSYNIVRILYGRGEITNSSLYIISNLVVLYLPGNLLLCIRDLLNRICYSTKYTYITAISASLGFISNIVLNYVLVKFFGIYGLAIATTISSILATTTLILMIKNKKILSKLNFNINFSIIIRVFVMISVNILIYLSIDKNINLISNILVNALSLIFSMIILNFDLLKKFIIKRGELK